jgi:hypothetical protein
MGDMADMMIDNFLFNEMDDWFNTYDIRVVTREKRKEHWERSIRDNEEYGVWQLGGKNPKKIFFKDLKFDHMVNIYDMLKRRKTMKMKIIDEIEVSEIFEGFYIVDAPNVMVKSEVVIESKSYIITAAAKTGGRLYIKVEQVSLI